MINIYNLVPTIYSNASRDFQYLSWLINIVLNSVKHNVDDMYELPNSTDPRLSELLAFTLGFKVRRNYDQKQLIAVVSILPSILKCKGSINALWLVCNALTKSSGVTEAFDLEDIQMVGSQIEIACPKDLIDLTLLLDLLPYIAPAGVTFKITRKSKVKISNNLVTNYQMSEGVYYGWHEDITMDNDLRIDGLSSLDDIKNTGRSPWFTNYLPNSIPNQDLTNKDTLLNMGLADNTIIPVIEDAFTWSFPEPESTEDPVNNTPEDIEDK